MTFQAGRAVGVLGVLFLSAHLLVAHAHDDHNPLGSPVHNQQVNCPIHNGFMEDGWTKVCVAVPGPIPESPILDGKDLVPRPAPPLPSRPRAPPPLPV